MNRSAELVLFTVEDKRLALPFAVVERIVAAVEVTPLPSAPKVVLGAINVRGQVVPVLDLRNRFGFPQREIRPSDWFIIVTCAGRKRALVADSLPVLAQLREEAVVPVENIFPGIRYITGVAKSSDGLVVIHDLEKFLSVEEEQSLQEAMANT